jgi:uncharacterized YccA/Bax inhibitor family protein
MFYLLLVQLKILRLDVSWKRLLVCLFVCLSVCFSVRPSVCLSLSTSFNECKIHYMCMKWLGLSLLCIMNMFSTSLDYNLIDTFVWGGKRKVLRIAWNGEQGLPSALAEIYTKILILIYLFGPIQNLPLHLVLNLLIFYN